MQPIQKNIDIAIKGRWYKVPALEINGKDIIVKGRFIRLATVNAEEWLETEVQDPEACVQVLKQSQFGADIFSFAQKLPATRPVYNYPMEWDSIAAVRIKSYREWWERVPQETRKNVRRAQKRGVLVRVRKLDEDLVQDLRELNNDSPLRQGKKFAHYGKTLDQVRKDQQAFLDRCDYICAYYNHELIGVMKLIYQGDVASILTFLPKPSHHDKRPANALMAKAIELCAEKAVSYLVFGMFNYSNNHNSSLREFKIRNRFDEILIPRYYVPLTRKGALSIKLRLHRGLIRMLPGIVIAVLVNVRARFYGLRMSRCSSRQERPNCDRQMERSTPPAGSSFSGAAPQ
jgi:hypothetical protein